MIQLIDDAGRKPDLVSVRTVARRRRRDDLSLRKFSNQRLAHGSQGISGSRQPHRRIHIGTTGKGIADRPSETGRRSAERFDLGRVIVGLVFEQ